MTQQRDIADDTPLRILSVLGQKPGMTGSGVLLHELWKCARDCGDEEHVIVAGYPSDDYHHLFGANCHKIDYSHEYQLGQLPFPVLGMSDVMPYPSKSYLATTPEQIRIHLREYSKAIRACIREFQPHLIHIHHLWLLVSLAIEFPDIPAFVTIHGTGLKQLSKCGHYRHYIEQGLPYVDTFFSVSHDILNDAVEEYPDLGDRIVFMGNGFNETIFGTVGDITDSDMPVILCVGKFVDWKGYRFLIRACARVPREHRLVIIGSGPQEDLEQLQELTREVGIHNTTEFLGQVDQPVIARWMRRADIFVLPSVKEPFGLALLEAMACGCPAIAADAGGPRDLLTNELRDAGLATLVKPLKPNGDDCRYVHDLTAAIDNQLARGVTPANRQMIADSVAAMTWRNVYGLIRNEYLKVLRTDAI